MRVSDDTLLRPRAAVTAKPISDGAVVVNMESGACFELNRVGFEIWGLLAEGADRRSICVALAKKYSVAAETLSADVTSILDELVRQGLLETVARPNTAP